MVPATGFYHEITDFWWNPATFKLFKAMETVVKYHSCEFFMKPSLNKLRPR